MKILPLSPAARRVRPLAVPLFATGLLLAVTGCSSATAPTEPTPAASTSNGLPGGHVHGLSASTDSGEILLATHEGLFDVSKDPARKIGPEFDMMGFAATNDANVFYASGHPAAGDPAPNPVGLLRSSDGGESWETLSREGESDFHALASTASGIVAFDGTLRTSADGITWTSVEAPFAPFTLVAAPTSNTVLATTESGPYRSTDSGKSWSLPDGAPVIQYAAFASQQDAFGISPDGVVHFSDDAGTTWARAGRVDAQVEAIAATTSPAGKPLLHVATTEGLLVSTDTGATFTPPAGD